jgi:hypothetical protein
VAQLLGSSQAWEQVVQVLRSRKLSVQNPSDLKKLLSRKESEYKKRNEEETVQFEDDLKRSLTEMERLNKTVETRLAEFQQQNALEIEFLELAILLLRDQSWIFQKLRNRSIIKGHKREIERRKRKQDTLRNSLLSEIRKLKASIEYRQTHRDTIISNSCSSLIEDIAFLKRVVVSPEMAGADAELQVIDHLKKLPDNCYVISGITLVRDKAKQFDGQWLKSAQIDHLVITSAGVFVIEAKNWSKDFAEHGDYFDPYQQVKRANYLCYEILKSPLLNLKVRSIIAHRGEIPAKPTESHVKVLSIGQVNNYILWFKDKMFSDSQMREMISCLRIWSKNGF